MSIDTSNHVSVIRHACVVTSSWLLGSQPAVLLTQSLPIHGVKHLNHNESGESHGGWLVALKNVTVEPHESFVLYQALRMVGLNGDKQP